MPRRNSQNRRRAAPPGRSFGGGYESAAEFRGETYTVRAISGQNSAKAYRCPGCEQLIASGAPHVVAWPHRDLDATDRRHWHKSCWDARERRGPRY